MLFSEIFLIALVCIFVLKPSDTKFIVKYITNFLRSINKIKNDFLNIIYTEESLSIDDQEEINKYLSKIVKITDKAYEGKYDIKEIKKYYITLLKNISNASDNERNNS